MPYIHYYYGNGAGKTTAAFGLLLRASAVMDVCAVQFLKDGTSGEVKALEKLGIEVLAVTDGVKFIRSMTGEDRRRITARHNEMLKSVLSGGYGLAVLDELCDAYTNGLADRELVEQLLASPPCELVITGHKPEEEFISHADYVTEFVCHEHPYKHGISARKGIEY